MALTFRYRDVPRLNKTRAKTPSIPITSSGKGGKYEFISLLDSGADISAIPKQMAELLNLDISGPKEEAFGIGGSVPAVQTTLHIELGKQHEKYLFDIPVKVILTEDNFSPLIGRAVFFDKFTITFKQNEEKVMLKAVTSKYKL